MIEAASTPYATLNNTIQGTFKQLGDLIDSYQKTKTDLNTQHYLDQLDAYTDPAKLQQARESGAIEALRNSYGRYFDRAATRGSDEARLNSLQEVNKGHQQYQDMVTRTLQRPLVNQAQQMIMNGESADKVNAFINEHGLLESEDLRKFQMDWNRHTAGLDADRARAAYSRFQLTQAMDKAREDTQRKEMIRARNQLGNQIAQQEFEGNAALSRLIESNPEIASVLKKNASGEGYDFIGSINDLGKIASTKPVTDVSLGDKLIAELTGKAKDNVDSKYPKQHIPKYKLDRGELPPANVDPRILVEEYEAEKNRLIKEEKDRQIAEQNAQIKANADRANNAMAILNKYAAEYDLYTKLKDHSDEVRALRDMYVNNGVDPEAAYEVFNPSATSPFTLPSYGSAYDNRVAEGKAQDYYDNKTLNESGIGATNNLSIVEQDKGFENIAKQYYPEDDEKRIAMADGAKMLRTKGIKVGGELIKIPYWEIQEKMKVMKFGWNNRDHPQHYYERLVKSFQLDLERDPSLAERWRQEQNAADLANMRNWGKSRK